MKLADCLLVEGKFDALVTYLSRKWIRLFKNMIHYDLPRDALPVRIINPDLYVSYVVLKVEQETIEEFDFSNVSTEGLYNSDDRTIEVNIIATNVKKGNIQHLYNTLVAETKETLKHELMHANQVARKMESESALSDSRIDYFKTPHELEAWAVGMHKTAKVKRIPLERAIITWLLEEGLNYGSDKDIEKFFEYVESFRYTVTVWVYYILRRFPTTRLETPGFEKKKINKADRMKRSQPGNRVYSTQDCEEIIDYIFDEVFDEATYIVT